MAIKIKDADGNEHEVLTSQEQTDMVTGAVNKSAKKLQVDLTTALTASLGEPLGKTLTDYDAKRKEEAEAAETERQAQAAAGGSKAPAGGETVRVEDSPAFRSLLKKFEAAEKARDASEAKARAEATKTKDTSLRQRISEELDKNGFDSKARHLALSHLVDGAKLARWSEDGETIVFKDTDGSDVDLPTGLKSFAQTDDGKRFMPASGASGTGDRSRFTPTSPKSGKIDSNALGNMALSLMNGFPQSTG